MKFVNEQRESIRDSKLILVFFFGSKFRFACNCIQSILIDYFFRYKLVLADDLVELLDPIRLKIEDYLRNRDYLESVLRDGRDAASQIAQNTMAEVKTKIGVNIS